MNCKRILGLVCMLLAIFVFFKIRWSNVDMTETRLFIEYWEWYLGVFILEVVGYFLIYKEK